MTTLLGLLQVGLVLAVFWLPGLAVLHAWGLRGRLRLAAASPVATLGVFFAGAVAAGALHVRWTLTLALACVALVALVGLAVRGRLVRPRASSRGFGAARAWGWDRPLAVVVAGAVLVQLLPVWRPMLRREQVANLPDDVFHLNALQFVRLEGAADPTTLGTLIEPVSGSFYPSGWHAVAGTIPVVLDGTSLLAAASFAVIALGWSLGLAALAREVAVTARRTVVLLAAALGAAGMASPLEPALSLGILPNAVGLALLPGVVAALLGIWRRGGSRPSTRAAVTVLLALGLAGCHPSAFAGAAIVLLPWVAGGLARWWRRVGRLPRLVVAGTIVVALAAVTYFVVANPVLAGVRGHRSESAVGLGDALIGLVFGFTWEAVTFAIVLPALAVLGWVLRFRRRQDVRPFVSWCLIGATYVLASMDVSWARPVTGFFYVEGRRVAPAAAVWSVVLAAEGLARGARWLVARTELPAGWRQAPVLASVCGFVVLLTPWQPLGALTHAATDVYTTRLAHPVQVEAMIPFFTPDELAMVNRLPAELPPDTVLFGPAKSGASYVYGLTGVRAFPFARGLADDLTYAGNHIADIATDPRVCAALRAHGVTHVYNDPDLWKAHGWPIVADPFADLPGTDFRLVDRGGYAAVYLVTGCGR